MPAYLVYYQDYEDYAFMRFYSESEYTQKEFDKIIEKAMEHAVQKFNKLATYKCEYFQPYEFFGSYYEQVSEAFKEYLLKYDIKSDPATMSYEITEYNIPKTDPHCDCKNKCMYANSEVLKDFHIAKQCRYKDRRIQAIKNEIQCEKNKEKAYQNDPIGNANLIKECQREIKKYTKKLKKETQE